MLRFIKGDIYKSVKLKTIFIIFGVVALSAILLAYISHKLYTGDMTPDAGVNASLMGDCMMVAIVGGLLAAELIVSDFETKSVHNEIISGKSRFDLIIAKLISFAIHLSFVLLSYAIVVLVGIGSGISFAPLNGVPSTFFSLLSDCSTKNDPNILKCVVLCLVIFIAYISKLSICIPLAFKCRKRIPVLVLGFSTSFIFDIIRSVTKKVDGLSDFIDALPYSQITKVTIGASWGTIGGVLASSLIFIAAMVIITYFLFRKLEIK